MLVYMIAIIVLCIAALVATFLIGFSNENKEETTHYSRNTKKNYARLLGIYAVSTVLIIILLVALN